MVRRVMKVMKAIKAGKTNSRNHLRVEARKDIEPKIGVM